MRTDDFVVAGWHNGTSGWGLRVYKEGRDVFQQYRDRLDQEGLVVVLPGACAPIQVALSAKFWCKCPEVRDAEIGHWMRSRKDAPWPHGRPPRYRACLVVGRELVLSVDKTLAPSTDGGEE